ncbi:MAG: phosphotriesterase-related protein [Lacunisphaera sp.]|nr:phosphotriesterase-related protein [Lacunisphaera sp.]
MNRRAFLVSMVAGSIANYERRGRARGTVGNTVGMDQTSLRKEGPQVGKVQTVLGRIDPERLGVTLTHEHLLSDLSIPYPAPPEAAAREFYYKPVSLETLGYIRYYSAPNKDNLKLLDIATAINELKLYKKHGGNSVVDATSVGLARNPVGLARISQHTGLNIIMGSSYYVDAAHPPDMDKRSEDDLVNEIVRDLTEGVEDTGIQAGIIGEVGCSWPLTEKERKVLRASGRASRLTGAPILIHPGRDENAPLEILETLNKVGADLGRTIMGHLERTVFKRATLKQIAESGCYLEWDHFGYEHSYYPNNPKIDLPSDADRMDVIAWVISEGYGDKVLLSHDVATKSKLIKYGGHGYFYILSHIVPRMRSRGFKNEDIHKMLVDNPSAILTFSTPKDL